MIFPSWPNWLLTKLEPEASGILTAAWQCFLDTSTAPGVLRKLPETNRISSGILYNYTPFFYLDKSSDDLKATLTSDTLWNECVQLFQTEFGKQNLIKYLSAVKQISSVEQLSRLYLPIGTVSQKTRKQFDGFSKQFWWNGLCKDKIHISEKTRKFSKCIILQWKSKRNIWSIFCCIRPL